MLQLIADSGSTKTDWILLKNSSVVFQAQTKGLNPYFTDNTELHNVIVTEILPLFNETNLLNYIHFYGAGCSNLQLVEGMKNVLQSIFPHAAIYINTDLLGVARALFQQKKGIACILGTGSNACLYDGTSIISNPPSLGYIFGDEGSAAHIGKTFINDFLKNKLPKNLNEILASNKAYELSNILTNVYKKPFPNRYLAEQARIIKEYIELPYCHNLVMQCFREFVQEYLLFFNNYKTIPISFCGSTAFHFQQQLTEVLAEFNLQAEKIVEKPIDDLIKYHLPQ